MNRKIHKNELTDKTKVSMKTRVITALVGLAIILPGIFLGDWFFFALCLLVTVIVNYEIINCAKKDYSPWLYVLTILFGLLITFWPVAEQLIKDASAFTGNFYSLFSSFTLPIAILFAGICLLFLMVLGDEHFKVSDAFAVFTLVVLVALGVQSLMNLRYLPSQSEHVPNWASSIQGSSSINAYDNFASSALLIYIAIATFFTDIGAYFVGVFFGKRKINPRISPNKTVEGFIGGIVVSFVFSSAFAFILAAIDSPILNVFDMNHWFNIVILSLIMPLFATLGDFVFSSVKRWYEIKDYGYILPGHGGILDRIDSIVFVAIAATIYIQMVSSI